MKVCTCLLLFGIFAFTDSVSSLKLHAALDTVTDSVDDRSRGTKNLDNEHNFKAKNTDKNNNLKLVFRAPKVESFTDFIQENIDILNVFEDASLEEFFYILDNEIRNYHYKGCKFSELMENRDTRNLLTRTLKTIRWKPVTVTKANINELADKLRDETYDNSVKELLNYINSLYKNSKKMFHRFLNNLSHYGKSKSVKAHNDLVQVVRDGVRTILFNRYTKLDTNTRRELIARIETFWEKFKKIPNSNAGIHNVDTDLVIEPIIKSFEVSKNEMNELKESELHFNQDPQTNLKNKRGGRVIEEAYDDHSKDKEVEDDFSSNESGKQATDYTAEELSSRQSFDSSSNSIKLSQERQEEYNTQRYMTLYTEEISYKARTTKKTEIKPMSKNVMTRRHRDQRRSTTTPSYRPRDEEKKKIEMLRTNQNMDDKKQYIDLNLRHDTHEPRARTHSAQQRESRKPDKSRSKSRHKNAQIYSQYDAVIDVRLDNTDLLESLRMFAPAEMATKHDTSPYPTSAAQRRTKTEIKPQSPTSLTTSPLRHSISFESHHIKPVNESRRRISPVNNGPVERYIKDKKTKKQSPARRTGNDTKDFNEYVIKRIDALEIELQELKRMHNVAKVHENNTDEIQVSNVTPQRKDMKDIDIERLSQNQNLDEKDVIKANNTDYNTNDNETNTYSSSSINNTSAKPDTMNINLLNEKVIENKTTTRVTDNNTNTTTTDTEISKEATTDTVTSTARNTDVTYTTTVESNDTTTPSEIPRRTMAYSQPMYYDYPERRLDPFDHINDGLDLNM